MGKTGITRIILYNMKPTIKKISPFLLIIMLFLSCMDAFPQQGLTLEKSLSIAETNSPSMQKTRLGLIRSQENLNAQNAALKSNFSLTLNPYQLYPEQGI